MGARYTLRRSDRCISETFHGGVVRGMVSRVVMVAWRAVQARISRLWFVVRGVDVYG